MTEGFLNIIRWKTNLLCVVLSYFFVVWVGFCVWAQRGGRTVSLFFNTIFFTFVTIHHASRQTSVSKSSFQRVSSQHFKTTKSTMYSMECTIECAENCSVRCASAEFDGIDLRRRTSFSTNKEKDTRNFSHTHEISHAHKTRYALKRNQREQQMQSRKPSSKLLKQYKRKDVTM